MRRVTFTPGDRIMMASLDKGISLKESCQLKSHNWRESRLMQLLLEKSTLSLSAKMYLLPHYARRRKLRLEEDVNKNLKNMMSKDNSMPKSKETKESTPQLHHWGQFQIINEPIIIFIILRSHWTISNQITIPKRIHFLERLSSVHQQTIGPKSQKCLVLIF